MQTFLPYSSYPETMKVLDDKRLGNQIYREGITLLRGHWTNHPASKIWRGYEWHLAWYCFVGLEELYRRRGKRYTSIRAEIKEFLDKLPMTGSPPWLGCKLFHDSHKSNLLRKDKEHYSQFNWDVPNDLPYFWPVDQ